MTAKRKGGRLARLEALEAAECERFRASLASLDSEELRGVMVRFFQSKGHPDPVGEVARRVAAVKAMTPAQVRAQLARHEGAQS